MQQSLDRRQPSARFRPQLREIPLQRRHASGENNRQRTSRDDPSGLVASCATAPRDLPPRVSDERRTGHPFRGGAVLAGGGNARDTTARHDIHPEIIQAEIAATAGPEVLEEHGAAVADQRLTGAPVPGDVELSAAPAAEPLGGVGEPEQAPDLIPEAQEGQEGRPADPRGPEVLGADVGQVAGRGVNPVRSLVSPAALTPGTAMAAAEHVNQPTVKRAGGESDDAQPADGHMAEERQPSAVVPAADLPSGDLPVVSDQAWEWMEPLLPSPTGRRGRRWRDHRQVVEAICWKYRTGSTWRELPARFGPWQTAYERLTRWKADGTWAMLLARAQTDAAAAGELDWLAAVDSTVVRVQHGPSARRVGGNEATASPDEPEEGAAA
jgi:transposase